MSRHLASNPISRNSGSAFIRLARGGLPGAGSTSGQMLIIVLWVMGLMSVAAGTVSVSSTHALRLSRVAQQLLKQRAIAQAAVQQAISIIREDSQEEPRVDHLEEAWAQAQPPSPLENVAVGDGHFSIGIQSGGSFIAGMIDEERKLSLNHAGKEELERLISEVGEEEPYPDEIAEAIIDWRTESQPAEGPYCQGRNPPCHNAPFESVEELVLVPGISPDLFEALSPYVTAYTDGSVNINTASDAVLAALGYDEETVSSILSARLKTPFSHPPEDYPKLAAVSNVFTVPVEALIAGAPKRAGFKAVIDRSGKILSWR